MSLWISDCNISLPEIAIAISTSKGLGSGTSGSAVCISD
jgi:hypothetical protein